MNDINVPIAPNSPDPGSAATVTADIASDPVTPTAPAAPQGKRRLPNHILVVAGIFLMAILITAVFYVRSLQQTPIAVTPTPIEAPPPTPTPIRTPSRLASTSAFMSFQSAVSSLSAGLQILNINDPSFTPPILNTDLGLSP